MSDELTPEQAAKARAMLRANGIREAQISAQADLRKRRKPIKHRPGMHWYEMISGFDPLKIEATPIADGGFMLGMLDEMSVVEVPEDMDTQRIDLLGRALNELGVPALVVRRGIKFLRLRACTLDEEQRLDAISEAQTTEVPDAENLGS